MQNFIANEFTSPDIRRYARSNFNITKFNLNAAIILLITRPLYIWREAFDYEVVKLANVFIVRISVQ